MKGFFLVCLVFLFLTCLLTMPLSVSSFSHIPFGTDAWQNVWNFWWAKETLLEGQGTLWWTDGVFYPTGVRLELTNWTYLFALVSIPIQLLASPEFALNLFLLFSTFLCAVAAYLLGRKAGLSPVASLLAGAVFGFSPLRMIFTFAGQLDTSAAFGLPLGTLVYLHWRQSPRVLTSFLLAASLIMCALISWYTVFLLVFLLLIFAGYDFFHRVQWTRQKKAWGLLLVVIVLPSAVLMPLILPMLDAASVEMTAADQGELGLGSAPDLLAFVIPDPYPFWRGTMMRVTGFHFVVPLSLAEKVYDSFPVTPLSKNAFAGYVPIFLAVLACLRLPRRTRPWLLLAVAALVLALGPRLQVGGSRGVLMPYALFGLLPGFSLMRCPHHFTLLYLLAVAVTAGMGLDCFAARISCTRKRACLGAGLILIALADVSLVPNRFLEDVSDLHASLEAIRSQERFPVLDVPAAFSAEEAWFASRYLYLQTCHQQPIVCGYTSRYQGVDLYGVTSRYPILRKFSVSGIVSSSETAQSGEMESPTRQDVQVLRTACRELGIEWIVLHRTFVSEDISKALDDALRSEFGVPEIYNERFAAFRVVGEQR